MSRASTMPAINRPARRSRPRIDPALLAAAALFAALVIGELIVILHAGPVLDPLALYFVT